MTWRARMQRTRGGRQRLPTGNERERPFEIPVTAVAGVRYDLESIVKSRESGTAACGAARRSFSSLRVLASGFPPLSSRRASTKLHIPEGLIAVPLGPQTEPRLAGDVVLHTGYMARDELREDPHSSSQRARNTERVVGGGDDEAALLRAAARISRKRGSVLGDQDRRRTTEPPKRAIPREEDEA